MHNENEVVSLIRRHPRIRLQAIGIGNGVSKNLIIEAANEGKGKYEFVTDNNMLLEKLLYLI